ncbi:MAG: Gfo/Idh/MocA family oxidoreductase, partial [Magnetococcales bacterium]|nr:Gfo/Idh/MocA family oxidoreductase [Magnetococcales bacterium]
MIRVGVIGYGYWGPNLVRNFAADPQADMALVCDPQEDRCLTAQEAHEGLKSCRDAVQLIHDPNIDAVAIATPVSTHFPLAKAALEAGKHVLVEKPITQTAAEAQQLIEIAERNRCVLMVDHTYVYTAAVRKIKQLIDDGTLGDVLYYDSVRVNLGIFQHDVDVIWDLAVHDLAILDYLLDQKPVAVSACGKKHADNNTESLAFCTFFFDSDTIAHINVNWLAPVKIRRALIGGNRKMIIFDDLEPSEKIRVYDKGVTYTEDPGQIYRRRVDYRIGDMHVPFLDRYEALQQVVHHFLDCIIHDKQPQTDGHMGLRIVHLLEAAS